MEPTLYDSFCDGDALVFRQSDLEDPARSDAFVTARLIAEQERDLIPLLRALEEACWTGGIPGTVPRAVFDAIAARRGVTVQKSLGKPAETPSWTTAAKTDEEAENAPLVTIGAEAEVTPLVSNSKQWFATIRAALRRQKVREWSHRLGTLGFYGGMTALWVNPALVPLLNNSSAGGDAFGFRLLSFFLLPTGTAIAYYLWPRNLDGIEMTEAIASNNEQVTGNFEEIRQSRSQLYEINRDPSYLSAVAFVAAHLRSVRIENCPPESLNLSADEWNALHTARIETLADISMQSVSGMSGAAREQLYSLRQTAMQQARNAYEQVAHLRRTLQRESEQLETEREGLMHVSDELNERLARMGEENFYQFIASLFRI